MNFGVCECLGDTQLQLKDAPQSSMEHRKEPLPTGSSESVDNRVERP
jgi:hypothetical protein